VTRIGANEGRKTLICRPYLDFSHFLGVVTWAFTVGPSPHRPVPTPAGTPPCHRAGRRLKTARTGSPMTIVAGSISLMAPSGPVTKFPTMRNAGPSSNVTVMTG